MTYDPGMGWLTDADFLDGGTPEDDPPDTVADGGGPDSF